MTWDYYDIQKEDKRYPKGNLKDSIDRALARDVPQAEKDKKWKRRLLGYMKDAVEAKKTGNRIYFPTLEQYQEFQSAIDEYISVLDKLMGE